MTTPTRFDICLSITLAYEGGWSDHPSDPGGATMKGVTLATFRRYYPGATKADLRAITDAQVSRIYREGYWNVVRGDDLPAGVDLAVFDAAVNSGPMRAAKWLQGVVGVSQDGVIGPKTLTATKAHAAALVVGRFCDARLAFLRGLSTWPTFGKGWERRVYDTCTRGIIMAETFAPPPTGPRWLEAIMEILRKLFRHL